MVTKGVCYHVIKSCKCHCHVHVGSMIPFMLRLLDAELPQYCREPTLALDRLYMLKESCEKVKDDTCRC